METIEVVQHTHIKRCGCRSLFFVTVHVEVLMVIPPVSETVNEPGITMKRENDRLVRCEQRVESMVGQTVRVHASRLESHQINNVDNAYLQLRCVPAQNLDGCQCLEGRHIAATGHHHIR